MIFLDLKPGKSVEGNDILGYRSEEKSSEYIYLIAGVHGHEVEGVSVLQNLFEWLKSNDELKLSLIVIPILNVDGYRSGTRVNSHGVDLNRNLATNDWEEEFSEIEKDYCSGQGPLSEPENKYLAKLFDKFPPKLVISFHSCEPGINCHGDCKEIGELVRRYNSFPITHDADDKNHGTLGKFALEKFNCPVLTLDTSVILDDKSLNDIWEENKTALIKLMNSDLLS